MVAFMGPSRFTGLVLLLGILGIYNDLQGNF